MLNKSLLVLLFRLLLLLLTISFLIWLRLRTVCLGQHGTCQANLYIGVVYFLSIPDNAFHKPNVAIIITLEKGVFRHVV